MEEHNMTDTADTRTPFTLNGVEYFIEELTDEQRTQLNLIVASENTLSRLTAESNLMMIAKEKIIIDLQDSLNNENTSEISEYKTVTNGSDT